VSRSAVSIIMAGAAVVTLLMLIASLRRARAAGDLDAASALTLGMGWLLTLPIALVAISGGLSRRPNVFGELVPAYPGWHDRAIDVSMLLVALLASVLLLRQLMAEHVPIHVAGVFAVLLWAVAQVSGLHDGSPTFRGAVLLACLLAATVLPRGRGAALGAGIIGVTLAISSGLLAVLRHDVTFVVPCEGACGGLGFTGVFPNPDLLGVALAASIPFAYLGFRGRARSWFILYLAGMAIATGSQTATVAVSISVAALLVLRPDLERDRPAAGRAAIAGLGLAGALFSSVYVLRRDWEPSALTERPILWNVASDYVERSPWFGYGPHRWELLVASGEIPRAAERSAHNQWMDVLFGAGWVGLALLVGVLVATVSAAGHGRAGVLLAAATIMTIGTTEGIWSIGVIDFLSFSLVALILTGQPQGVPRLSPRRARAPLAHAALRSPRTAPAPAPIEE
jgi:O-antigen ligase